MDSRHDSFVWFNSSHLLVKNVMNQSFIMQINEVSTGSGEEEPLVFNLVSRLLANGKACIQIGWLVLQSVSWEVTILEQAWKH